VFAYVAVGLAVYSTEGFATSHMYIHSGLSYVANEMTLGSMQQSGWSRGNAQARRHGDCS
jgi:hypothetical protein